MSVMRTQVCHAVRDRAAEFACGFDPIVDYDLGVCDGFGVRLTISQTAWQFRHFDNKALVVFAPGNDQLVACRHWMSILYFKSSWRLFYLIRFRFSVARLDIHNLDDSLLCSK